MSWVTAVWLTCAAACLSFAGVHLMIWLRARSAWANLAFACACLTAAAMCWFELALMRSQTPEQYGSILRLMHIPFWTMIVSLVVFVRSFLKAGRIWLAWLTCGMRTLATVVNFVCPLNLNFLEISRIQPYPLWGETVAVPVGITNPLVMLGQASSLLFLAFVVDATVTAWRRGERRRALVVGGTLSLAHLSAVSQAALLVWGIVPMPYFAGLLFFLVILVMGYELSQDVLRAAEISRELAQSEQRLRLVADATGLRIWEWSPTAGHRDRDQPGQAAANPGSREPRMCFEEIEQSAHADDREQLRRSLAKTMTEGGELECEFRLGGPDGRARWMLARGHPLRDQAGKTIRVQGISLDVSQRKAAELAAKDAGELNRSVLDSIESEIAILDNSGTIIAVNQAWVTFARQNGVPCASADFGVGVNYAGVCHAAIALQDETARTARDGVLAVLSGAEACFELEYTCEFLPEKRWFQMRVLPLQRAAGGLLVSHTEITGRKLAEQELQQKRDELAHVGRVAALGELSGSLAHELNQPLAAILHNANAAKLILGQDPLNREMMAEILDEIVRDDRRAGGIIHRVELLMRKGEIRFELLDANQVVAEVLELLRNELIKRKVKVSTRFSPKLPRILGDRVQLQQVLLNLITNACHAMAGVADPQRILLVNTAVLGNEQVQFSVSDRGCGIPPEHLTRIFDPFFSTRPQGMGMGLAICRSILDTHRGRLWAENNPAAGAAFHFTIPLAVSTGDLE